MFSGWAQDLAFLGPDEAAHLLPWDELPADAEGAVSDELAAVAAPQQGDPPEATPWQAWEAAAAAGGWHAQPSDLVAGYPAELAGSGRSQQVWQQLPKTAAERLKRRLETVAAERQLGEALSMHQQLLAAEAVAAVEGESDGLDRSVCIAGLQHFCAGPAQSRVPHLTHCQYIQQGRPHYSTQRVPGMAASKRLFALSARLDAVAWEQQPPRQGHTRQAQAGVLQGMCCQLGVMPCPERSLSSCSLPPLHCGLLWQHGLQPFRQTLTLHAGPLQTTACLIAPLICHVSAGGALWRPRHNPGPAWPSAHTVPQRWMPTMLR